MNSNVCDDCGLSVKDSLFWDSHQKIGSKEIWCGKDRELLKFEEEFLKIGSILTTLKLKGMWSNDVYPMLSLPFLDWFNSYDFSDWDMVEIGAGNSTIYFPSKTKTFVSLETDSRYYNYLLPTVEGIVDLRFLTNEDVETGNYSININEKTIVLIDNDGNRLKTTKSLISKGKPNIVLIDNSEWFPNLCNFLYESGYSEIPFWGIRFEQYQDKCTSVFIKDGFKLPRKKYDYFVPGTFPGLKTHNDTD
jgi:hypothetical protein